MILCSGAFDGLHPGHLAYLREARALLEQGEHLVIAVAPDDYLRDVKGREPQWPASLRVQAVMGLATHVFVHDASGIAPDILERRPRLVVKGLDWYGRLPEDIYAACLAVQCAVAYVDSGSTLHTSDHAA